MDYSEPHYKAIIASHMRPAQISFAVLSVSVSVSVLSPLAICCLHAATCMSFMYGQSSTHFHVSLYLCVQ